MQVRFFFIIIFVLFCFALNRVSHSPGRSQTHFVAKDDLDLLILLSAEITGTGYHAQFYMVLETNSRGLCMLEKQSPN